MTDLAALDATSQAALVRDGDASPAELVDAAIERIEKTNPELNAVIHPLFDRARAAAAGTLPDGTFRGVPIVVKDLDGSLAGAPLHNGNKLLKELGHTGTVTSYLFQKLEDAGFVIVGKTNTPEFGLLPVAEPEAHGPTRNPWNTDHSAGGSSGGSGAVVASLMVPVAHGGDGGGSIRIPASMCGLFGMKPARGRVSLGPDENEGWAGLVVRGSLTHTVRDSAAILDVLQGYMPGDPYTAPPPARPYRDEVGTDPGRLRIAMHTTAPGELAVTDPECIAATEDAAQLLESLGHTVDRAAPPAFDEGEMLQSFTTILFASVAADIAHLSKLTGREITAADVEPMTWMYNEMARSVTAEQYVTALATAHDWSRRIVAWFFGAGYDLMLTPTMAEPPPEISDVASRPDDPMRPLTRALPFALYTGPFNMTGQPAMSVPTYWSAAGLPIGVQLVAQPNREDVLYRLAAQIEQARPWADRVPPLHA